MSELISELTKVGIVSLLAVISPGPDFAMVSRNSLVFSRTMGMMAALGLGTGVLFHVTLSLSGIALLMSQSPALFSAVKIAGSLYLIWLGFQSWITQSNYHPVATTVEKPRHSLWQAYRSGVVTNALNPKATLFVFSLYSQVIHPNTPFYFKLVLGSEVAVIAATWFCLVSLLLTHPRMQELLFRVQSKIDLLLGAVLVFWGIFLLGQSITQNYFR